jgi:hypothetical protein
MKKLTSLVAVLFCLSLSNTLHAQSNSGADFFEGRWRVSIPGTPIGDLKRIYALKKADSGLSGVVQDSTGKELYKCSKVDVKENEVTIYYTASGIDAYIKLTKKDKDHVSGMVLDQYPAEGERIKESNP